MAELRGRRARMLEAAVVLETTPVHLAQLRHRSRGPACIKLGRAIRNHSDDLDQERGSRACGEPRARGDFPSS